jgi:hypothetical protein
MKQGRADRSGPAGQKVEPVSYARNPGGVGNIGVKTGNHIMGDGVVRPDGGRTPVDGGRGYNPPSYSTGWDGSAPGSGMKTRRSGSQGKY